MPQNVLGVIGGSGFYQMKGLDKVELMELETPFGRPSDPFLPGTHRGHPRWFSSRVTVAAIDCCHRKYIFAPTFSG